MPPIARGTDGSNPRRMKAGAAASSMGAIAGDIAVWDLKAQALGIPLYQALGAARSSVRGYASGGLAPGDEAEAFITDDQPVNARWHSRPLNFNKLSVQKRRRPVSGSSRFSSKRWVAKLCRRV
jgi:hypothetical protein